MASKKYWTRKELASLLDISIQSVRDNETRLGLDKARANFNRRLIRYHWPTVEQQLRQRGILRS